MTFAKTYEKANQNGAGMKNKVAGTKNIYFIPNGRNR